MHIEKPVLTASYQSSKNRSNVNNIDNENPLDSKVNLIDKLGTKINIVIDNQDAKRASS